MVEAEAMGVPVIVTEIPGPTDAMEENVTGLVVKKADVDSLYEAMLQLIQDEAMCERFAVAGQKLAQNKFEQVQLFECILIDRKRLMGL